MRVAVGPTICRRDAAWHFSSGRGLQNEGILTTGHVNNPCVVGAGTRKSNIKELARAALKELTRHYGGVRGCNGTPIDEFECHAINHHGREHAIIIACSRTIPFGGSLLGFLALPSQRVS